MRVLFLCHRYTDTTIGGLAEFLQFLPPALRAKDVECIIYTQSPQKNDYALRGPQFIHDNIAHFSGPFLRPRFFIHKKELAALITLCQREKIDLVHAQGTYRSGFMAMHLKKILNIPYVVTSHSDIAEINSKRIQRGKIKNRCKKILKNADWVTHLAPHMEAISHAIYDTKHKSTLIHNGIDINAWQNTEKYPLQNYMLAIGRLEKEKGFPILIEAYKKLCEHDASTSLVIAGTGSIEKELHTQAKNLGLNVITDFQDFQHIPAGSVIFTGYVHGETKKLLFSQAKLLLFATQPKLFEEAFGIVQLEGMAAGKPIIASDITVTRYLKTLGMQAHLVEAENINAWAQGMLMLLNDKNLQEQMGIKNKKIGMTFSWDEIATQYANVYGRC